MTYDKSWPVARTIQLSAQYSAQVSDTDLHGISYSSLGLPGHVDSGPRQYQSCSREDSSRREKYADIADPRSADWIGVAKKDGIANSREYGRSADKDRPLAYPLGKNSYRGGRYEGESVRGYSKQLCSCGCIT